MEYPFSHLTIAAIISMAFSWGLEFWYARRRGKEEGKGMVETFIDMQNRPRDTREGFLHELITGAVFLVTATATQAVTGLENITIDNILTDLGVAAAFAIALYLLKKIL